MENLGQQFYDADVWMSKLGLRGVCRQYKLADMLMSMVAGHAVLDLYKFDDYLHDRFGDYESEGKNMSDMFHKVFPCEADYKKACELFAV